MNNEKSQYEKHLQTPLQAADLYFPEALVFDCIASACRNSPQGGRDKGNSILLYNYSLPQD